MKRLYIKANTYIYICFLLLILPIRWLSAWFVSIVFHEIFHWIVVKLCGGKVLQIQVGLGGANMLCSNLSEISKFLSILSGSIGGLLLTALGPWFPRVALCSFLLSIYNLLPLLPFDGGAALKILIKSNEIFCVIQKIILIIIFIIAGYASCFLHFGVLPYIFAFGIYLKNRNSPCNECICRVQ